MKSPKKSSSTGSGQGVPRRGSSRGWLYVFGGLVVLVIVIALAWPKAAPAAQAAKAAPVTNAERIDVVYFHRTERCQSCQWTGDTTRKTVETYFRDELASGRITLREVDVQQRENAVLARQYGAAYSSLFVNFVKDGRDHIVHASDTYAFIGNEARFAEVLRAKIATGLGGGL